MKFLRGLGVVLIAIVLFVIIVSFSLILRTKTFLEKEVLYPLVKQTATIKMTDTDITSEQKDFIDKIVNDKDFEKIIDNVVDNFLEYVTNDNYELSKSDYDIVINYILKYKDELNKYSNTHYTESEIRDALKYEDAKKYIKDAFAEFENEEDAEVIKEVITVYAKVTSFETKMLFISAIVVCILLIMLISWSLIKWMLVVGIDLIISGGLIGILYFIGNALLKGASQLTEEIEVELVKAINLNGYGILAIIEIVVGIVLIVLYSILKKNKPTPVVANQTQTI